MTSSRDPIYTQMDPSYSLSIKGAMPLQNSLEPFDLVFIAYHLAASPSRQKNRQFLRTLPHTTSEARCRHPLSRKFVEITVPSSSSQAYVRDLGIPIPCPGMFACFRDTLEILAGQLV